MSDIKSYCEVNTRVYKQRCGQPAVAFVTYYADGSGGVSACGKHLTKAVEEVLAAANATSGAVKVAPVGQLRARIIQKHNLRKYNKSERPGQET